MATNRIVYNKLESYAHENVLAYLDNKDYINDPSDPMGVRIFVYDSDPFHKGQFSGFPYIVSQFPTIEQSKVSSDGKTKMVEWKHRITVRTSRDGRANARSGVGRTDLLNISDDIFETFNSETRKQELRDLNMFFITITKVNTNTLNLDNMEVYENEYELTYSSRIGVSA